MYKIRVLASKDAQRELHGFKRDKLGGMSKGVSFVCLYLIIKLVPKVSIIP